MAVEYGEGEEDTALMIDPAEARVGDRIDALLAAVIGMGSPADVGQKACRMPEAAFICRLLSRVGEELIGPTAELEGMLDGSGPQRGVILAEADQRIAGLLEGRQEAVDQAFANSEDGEYDLARLHLA